MYFSRQRVITVFEPRRARIHAQNLSIVKLGQAFTDFSLKMNPKRPWDSRVLSSQAGLDRVKCLSSEK